MFRVVTVFGSMLGMVLGVMLVAVLAASLVGAFMGWVVGLFFPHTMYLLSTAMDIEASPWQLGLMFGFVGGFFKNTYTEKKD